MGLESWGRYPKSTTSDIYDFCWLSDSLPVGDRSIIPYGQGRSYGDACLNNAGIQLSTRHLNRLISFDREAGILKCESGVTLADILRFGLPLGWFLPVTPGTKFVSVGGAIANDVHGKNHHVAGSFGHHVVQFELLRSNGSRTICSLDNNTDLFKASIGGLGLTGLITWAEIKLKRVDGPYIESDSIKFSSLEEFFEISRSSDKGSEYTVAWLDCVASGKDFGRGIFMRGNHSSKVSKGRDFYKNSIAAVPFNFPGWALNSHSVKAFNFLYYNKQQQKALSKVVHYDPFFYPLDAVSGWNKIYGAGGLMQFQCVIPTSHGDGKKAIKEILQEIVSAQSASFLAVLKEFGEKTSLGYLSFPRQGITLCLDFAFKGDATLNLFKKLYHIVFANGGSIYPAKDACMTPEQFRQSFPNLDLFVKHIDPRFCSDYWRRVFERRS